jgi:hypothetical protein
MGLPIEPEPIKPGTKTTEFWVTIGTVVVGLLATTGIISPGGNDELIKALTTIIGGVATIVPAALYIYSRFHLKKEAMKMTGGQG